MKVTLSSVLVALLLMAFSHPAAAQMYPGGGPGPAMQEGGGKEITPEQFKEMKTRILSMLEERKKRLDQEKTCVEAATSAEELKKCRPERPMGGPGGQFQGGPNSQRPPRGGMGGQQQ